MTDRVLRTMGRVLALACLASIPVTLAAQTTTPAKNASGDDIASKWDIFLGYSFLGPDGTVAGYKYNSVNYGAIGSVTGYFNKHVGLQVEGSEHVLLPEGKTSTFSEPDNDFAGFSGGVVYRWPNGNMTPFVHALIGAENVGSYYQANTWGPLLTLGGGVDYTTPWFNHHFAFRLVQADYQYTHEDFASSVSGSFNMARLSAGIVFKAGSFTPPPPVTLACSASPAWVFPGDPVTVTATAGNLDPKLNAVYSWTGTGVSGSGTTVSVATASLAAGTYTVKGEVKEGKPGKEGMKPGETADCSASFTVKAYEPPTISCSASPSTLTVGDTSTITSTGMSPQNRPLTYSYSAGSGTIGGAGASATFSSTGAATGPVTIVCNVADDKGGTASNSTTVTVSPAYVAPPVESPEVKEIEHRLALHSVFFPTAQPRAEHPEGGLVASQEGTLTALATDFKRYLELKPDGRLTLTGHADVRGSAEYNQALSERRVARTKQFLAEHGVPEADIETKADGSAQELTVDQVKSLVSENPDLSAAERAKVLRKLNVIVLAQNRRVDVTLNNTGQQSVELYPFNAVDSMTLLEAKAQGAHKAAPEKQHKAQAPRKAAPEKQHKAAKKHM